MKLYNLLTNGRKFNNFYELLFSKYLSNDIPTYIEYTGELPITINCNGEPLVSWILWGNTTQSGTPTPTTPVDIIGVGELETTGEHIGQYKIPISSANIATNIYLGEVQSIRRIKKLVLTGEEDIISTHTDIGLYNIPVTDYQRSVGIITNICSHYKAGINVNGWSDVTDKTSRFYANTGSTANILYIRDSSYTSVTAFKSFLQQQYASGTPVTVWYVLATPETGAVNEPLMKIGDYADSVTNAATIPTNNGSTTISVDTTVQPSEVYIKYIGG